MKKTLIALAAVAATSASFAQVTLYGKVDLNLGKAIGAAGSATMQQASGSRWGIKGSEDLGGGLKAGFQLEHRFTPDNGGLVSPYDAVSGKYNSTSMFTGRSIITLNGGFGGVTLGRDYTAGFWTQLAGDPFGWDGVAAQAASTGAGVHNVRFNNSVNYSSPAFSGFKVMASYAVKEGANAVAGTPADVNAGTSVALSYSNGPLAASVATEKGTNANKYTGFNVSYDLGMAKVSLNSATGKPAAGGKNKGMTLGAVVPMGAITVKAAYGTLKVNDVTTSQKTSLGMRYALSKRTDMYANVANDSKKTANKSGYEFGIQHNF